MKLRYKFFIAFLTTSCMILVMLIGIMQFFVYRNFADFVNQTELSKLDRLVNTLAADYHRENGWEAFKNNPEYFINIIEETIPGNKQRHRPPDRRKRRHSDERPDNKRDNRRDFQFNNGPPPPPRPEPSNTGIRLCLFDADKIYIAGPLRKNDKFTYRKIEVNGNIEGWLGLKLIKGMRHPLEEGFFVAQKKAFLILGTVTFFFVVFISFVLSRHLLLPINELVKGTHAMSAFNFDTKINVSSGDELGRLADDFNNMAQTLKNYETMRKNWISDISHELRTPISILKGKIEAFQDGIRIVSKETLDSLHHDITIMEKLVEDLHLLSLIDSENIRITKDKIHPLQILKATIDSFQLRFEKQSIDIVTDFSTDLNFYIRANHGQIARVFSNIFENTLRYTDSPGGLFIASKTGQKYLELIFEDSAPGVPEQNLKMIFQRLYRVEKSRNRALGGSGLGLSICQKIIENHNGIIESAKSEKGGLKITIKLPI